MTPIAIEQTTLIKFFPELDINPIITDEKGSLYPSGAAGYSLGRTPDNVVFIKETHCLRCGKRLVKNGHNVRAPILDKGVGKTKFKIQRKRCKRCGEITPDYSFLAPKYGVYHENYKRRARQHYLEGLNPSQIVKVFQIDFDISISEASITNWVNKVAEPLRQVLEGTPVPSSGYWGYDEIYLKIRGEKWYAINTIDMNTRFIPAARIKQTKGKKAGRSVLVEARKKATLSIKGMVKDCTTSLGSLFRTRSFKQVELQNCLTHVKWTISKHVKAFAGLSEQSRKPVPSKWKWLLYRFYALLDTHNEADAYIQLEALRKTIEDLNAKRISKLESAIDQLEGWFPKLIAHQRNPWLPKTNNVTEGYHKKFQYYRWFKRQMMTETGAQRVLDYRVFRHNFKLFPIHIKQQEQKYEKWRILVRNCKGDPILRGQGNHFRSVFKKLDKWWGNYQHLWDLYFKKI